MAVEVRWMSDPACPWSWGAEPQLRHLFWEFGTDLTFSWVLGGMARSFGSGYRDSEAGIGSGADCFADLIAHWLAVAAASGMPLDPRLWTESRLSSTYPACLAAIAASEQGPEAGYRYLRRLREGPAEPLEAIDRFGRCATAELVELSGRPRPVVEAELWGLATEWRLKPIPVLTGTLWERA